MNRIRPVVALAVLVLWAASMAHAARQATGIERHEALRHDLDTPGREIVQVQVTFEPGAAFGMHTHPGVEVAYVLEGTLLYSFLDKPPVTLKSGESIHIPAGTAHAAHNPGKVRASELATYLVTKGRPIVMPVAAAVRQAEERTSHGGVNRIGNVRSIPCVFSDGFNGPSCQDRVASIAAPP